MRRTAGREFSQAIGACNGYEDAARQRYSRPSISAPGLFEAMSYRISKDHPLRALYLHQPPAPAPLEPAINCTLLHGVRASLELQRTHDREQALKASNPEIAPHLAFTDVGGHGYAVVRAGADDLEVEFVCVVRPLEKSDRPDGGPLAYRITHRARRWAGGAAPQAHADRGRAAALRLTARGRPRTALPELSQGPAVSQLSSRL
jgi:hypothetical protein